MKTYLFNTISRFRQYSRTLDAETEYCDKIWTVLTDDNTTVTYLLQSDHTLYVTTNGVGFKGSWKYIDVNKSIMLEQKDGVLMVHPSFVDDNILVLTLDGTNNCILLNDAQKEGGNRFKSLSAYKDYLEGKERQQLAIQRAAEEDKKRQQLAAEKEMAYRNRVEELRSLAEERAYQSLPKDCRIAEEFIDITEQNDYLISPIMGVLMFSAMIITIIFEDDIKLVHNYPVASMIASGILVASFCMFYFLILEYYKKKIKAKTEEAAEEIFRELYKQEFGAQAAAQYFRDQA